MIHLATTQTRPAPSCEVGDEHFIEALDFEFRDAANLARRMLAAGTPASLQSIRNRMAEFCEVSADVEAHGQSWRIVPPPSPPEPANDPTLAPGLHHGDCLELMKAIPTGAVNLVLGDLPYGLTRATTPAGNPIDNPLDLDAFWRETRRVLAPRGNVVMFASQPFSTDLINGARDWFKYSLVWRKDHATGYNHARNRPLKDFEDILIFSPGYNMHARKPGRSGTTENRATYNPWRARTVTKVMKNRNAGKHYYIKQAAYRAGESYEALEDCPRMVLEHAKERGRGLHPFQKPLPLLDDLIRMYSNPGETVLDPTCGSGSTAIAAEAADRRWIAIEKDRDIYEAARARIAAHE